MEVKIGWIIKGMCPCFLVLSDHLFWDSQMSSPEQEGPTQLETLANSHLGELGGISPLIPVKLQVTATPADTLIETLNQKLPG